MTSTWTAIGVLAGRPTETLTESHLLVTAPPIPVTAVGKWPPAENSCKSPCGNADVQCILRQSRSETPRERPSPGAQSWQGPGAAGCRGLGLVMADLLPAGAPDDKLKDLPGWSSRRRRDGSSVVTPTGHRYVRKPQAAAGLPAVTRRG